MVENQVSEQGLAVIRSFEGLSLKAYRDPVGIWTIGYGQTNSDATILGFVVKAGVIITQVQAESLLRASLARRYEPSVRKSMGPSANLPQHDAGCSFHYNTGAISSASWVKSFVAKNMGAVRPQIMLWNRAGGRVLAGLTRRRGREADMILKGDYGPEGRTRPVDLQTGKPVDVAPAAQAPKGNHQSYPGMMRLGDVGPEVRDYKQALVDNGYKIILDEKFDEGTEKATRDYQGRHPQLRVDGVSGPATRDALQRDADAKKKMSNTSAGAAASEVVATSADAVSGGSLPNTVYVVVAICFALALGYLAWQYRDEVKAMLKSRFKGG